MSKSTQRRLRAVARKRSTTTSYDGMAGAEDAPPAANFQYSERPSDKQEYQSAFFWVRSVDPAAVRSGGGTGFHSREIRLWSASQPPREVHPPLRPHRPAPVGSAGTPGRTGSHPGQHTAAIMCEILGYDDDATRAPVEDKVIQLSTWPASSMVGLQY